jgi:hypothetical protein
VSLVVTKAALTLRANDASKLYGAPLPAFSVTPTGFVNGDTLASLGGTLSFNVPVNGLSTPGSYPIYPYGATSTNYTITFVAGTLTVTKAATTVTVTTTPNPSPFRQNVQLEAVVSPVAPGAGTPTGYVEFRDNGVLIWSGPLSNGVATLGVGSFKRGTHQITATYLGDGNFTGSSGSRTHTVN